VVITSAGSRSTDPASHLAPALTPGRGVYVVVDASGLDRTSG
jgi:hypothetical protein